MKLIDRLNIEIDLKTYEHNLKEAEGYVNKLMSDTKQGTAGSPSPNVGGPDFCLSCMGISMD